MVENKDFKIDQAIKYINYRKKIKKLFDRVFTDKTEVEALDELMQFIVKYYPYTEEVNAIMLKSAWKDYWENLGSEERENIRTTAIKYNQSEEEKRDGDVVIEVNSDDNIRCIIHNGRHGFIKWKEGKKNTVRLMGFSGTIGPIVKVDDEIRIEFKFYRVKTQTKSIDDFLQFLKINFNLNIKAIEHIHEAIDTWAQDCEEQGNVEFRSTDQIYVKNGIITVNNPSSLMSPGIGPILKTLRDYYHIVSHQTAYISTFSWSLLAPLHYYLKKYPTSGSGIITPFMLEQGKSKGGKTSIGRMFIGRGYAQSQNDYYYPYQRIVTPFTLAKSLMISNLPMIADDVKIQWIFENQESLKSYVQTDIFFTRGRSDQGLNEGKGKRSIFMTMNKQRRIDDDLAFSLRLHTDTYTEENVKRKNTDEFLRVLKELPEGFMFDIFESIFAGKKLVDIVTIVEHFERDDEWINYGLKLINEKCREFGVEEFPMYDPSNELHNGYTNAKEFKDEILTELDRLAEASHEYYDKYTNETIKNSKTSSKLKFEIDARDKLDKTTNKMRTYIYFTGFAFKEINKTLRLPFRDASDFISGLKTSDEDVRVEWEGTKSMRLDNGKRRINAFCLSFPKESEDDDNDEDEHTAKTEYDGGFEL